MLPAEQLEALVLALHDIQAVRFGQFELHSGRTSPIYIDLRLLASYPKILRLAAGAYRQLLQNLTFDLLAATPLAGLPIGTAVSLETNMPLIYPRQQLKSYGTGKQIEGKWEAGQRVVVLDDLITSGDSLLKGITFLEAAGLQVQDAVVLIDREQGGQATLSEQGYTLRSAVTMNRLLEILESKERIAPWQRIQVLQSLS